MKLPRLYKRMLRKARAAIRRCMDPRHRSYKYYGALGVTVWTSDPYVFAAFLLFLPGCHDRSLSLDRIDPHRDYEPGNLRFSDAVTQANNKRKKRYDGPGLPSA